MRKMSLDYLMEDLNIHEFYKDQFNLQNVCHISKKMHLEYSVLAYSVKGDINIGKIMRSCELLGCKNFIIYGNKHYDRRYTHGSQHYLNVFRYRLDEISFPDLVKQFDVTPVFVEQGGLEVKTHHIFRGLPLSKPPLFVFGNESTGIPKDLMEEGSIILSLPQCGFLRSYNVSVSSGIVLNDYYRYCMESCQSIFL